MSKKSGSKRTKAQPSYLHKKLHKEVKNGVSTVLEENVMDGPKGVSFKFYSKKGDKTMRVVGKQDTKGNFMLKVMENNKVKSDEKDLSLVDLLKHIKKIKELDFAVKYLSSSKKQKGGYYHYPISGGAKRKGSRKGSRKASKKRGSKKASKKKASRKKSKKGSRKRSKKGRKRSKKY